MILEALAVGGLAVIAHDHGRLPWDDAFDTAAKTNGVPANLLRAIAWTEHGGHIDPSAVSPTRDYGIMQVNAKTLASMQVPEAQWLDPATNIDAAARYLVQLRRELGTRWNIFTWAAGYNVGPDLVPADVGERYGGRVLWHWLLFDVGRLET